MNKPNKDAAMDDLRESLDRMHQESLTRVRECSVETAGEHSKGLFEIVFELSRNTSTTVKVNPAEIQNIHDVLGAWLEEQK